MSIVYELEKKSSLVTCAFSAKSCTRDTDSLHSCTRLRLVQEMACLYHECKIFAEKALVPKLDSYIQNLFTEPYVSKMKCWFSHVFLNCRI